MTDLTTLKQTTLNILSVLSDASKSIDSITPLLHPSLIVTQDDNPTIIGAETIIAAWKKARSGASGFKYASI
jgi:hypothetical protein